MSKTTHRSPIDGYCCLAATYSPALLTPERAAYRHDALRLRDFRTFARLQRGFCPRARGTTANRSAGYRGIVRLSEY